MQMLQTQNVQCPYCWEKIDVVIDMSVDQQSYVEDCFVCCRPIQFHISVDTNTEGEREAQVIAHHEDE